MSSQTEILFYDLPSRRQPTCWSLNPWKARLVLNYKRIPYRTQWIEYPDLAPTLKSFGVPPNDEAINPLAEYSIPAIKLPDGRYVMDSLFIAKELEALQPSPSLRLEGNDYAERTQAAVLKLNTALGAIVFPRVPEMLLNPPSAWYFNETRAKRFGMPLTELAKSDSAGESAWTKAEAGLQEIKTLLHEHLEGPYVQGREPSFADFVLAGMWRFYERIDKECDLFGRVMKSDPTFSKHYEACKQWMDKDD